jgi:predicted phosphodiesterase
MRIVFLSDTHGATLRHPVPDGDVLVHCGDFSKKSRDKELVAFRDWFFSFPHNIKIFIAGNHDLVFERDPARARSAVPGGVYLLDQELTVDGVRFYGAPWTPEFYDWAFMKPRGSGMREVWQKIPAGTDILVTHGPPFGILDFVPHSEVHAGCEELAVRVAEIKPAVHAFGHIHEGYGTEKRTWPGGRETLFVNASNCDVDYDGINPPLAVDVRIESCGKLSVVPVS